MPIDYALGKIYKITSKQTDLCYIGSTTQPLNIRMNKHRQPDNLTSAKEILKYGDAVIELVEEYSCETKEQLARKEADVIQRTSNCVNKIKTVKEPEAFTDFLVYQDDTMFLVLSERERCYKKITKLTPVDAPPENVFVLNASKNLSALREYKYDLERKKKKYHLRKEERLNA
jgi:hypothetical protein